MIPKSLRLKERKEYLDQECDLLINTGLELCSQHLSVLNAKGTINLQKCLLRGCLSFVLKKLAVENLPNRSFIGIFKGNIWSIHMRMSF